MAFHLLRKLLSHIYLSCSSTLQLLGAIPINTSSILDTKLTDDGSIPSKTLGIAWEGCSRKTSKSKTTAPSVHAGPDNRTSTGVSPSEISMSSESERKRLVRLIIGASCIVNILYKFLRNLYLKPALRLVVMGYMVADAHLGARHTDSHAGKPASAQRACGAQDSSNVPPHVASPTVHGRRNASISSIPIELLTDIFEFCQPQTDRIDPLVPAAENIVIVCIHWRTIALAAPYLWSKIIVWDPRPIHVSIVRRYFERSKSCPLNVIIDQSVDADDRRSFDFEMLTDHDFQASTCSACSIKENKSNYWKPTLYFQSPKNGTFKRVTQPGSSIGDFKGGMVVYYIQVGQVTAFPKGFRMISGDPYLHSYNSSINGSRSIMMRCLETDLTSGKDYYGMPTTKCKGGVRSQINFPTLVFVYISLWISS
uniref:Putative carbohydrate-binding module family 1 protein n=1 Tax=Moniliophthora roreri TaxID=221103 RepID=A0A0W0FQH4_MONRR